jgi:hypothetical protein
MGTSSLNQHPPPIIAHNEQSERRRKFRVLALADASDETCAGFTPGECDVLELSQNAFSRVTLVDRPDILMVFFRSVLLEAASFQNGYDVGRAVVVGPRSA